MPTLSERPRIGRGALFDLRGGLRSVPRGLSLFLVVHCSGQAANSNLVLRSFICSLEHGMSKVSRKTAVLTVLVRLVCLILLVALILSSVEKT
jgi:hypothetical protein